MHFARVLRQAGMPVGTDRIQLALQALQVAGLESKRDFHDALAACCIDRIEHRELFDQAFALFWRDPDLTGRMRALLLPKVPAKEGTTPPPPENRRLGEALFPHQPNAPQQPPPPEQLEVDATLTWNEREVLRKADFETMTADEWREATAAAERSWRCCSSRCRRGAAQRAAHPGRPDGAPRCRPWRATAASCGRCAGARRASGRRRWWCWPTSRAR